MFDTSPLERQPTAEERRELSRREAAGEFGRGMQPALVRVLMAVAAVCFVVTLMAGLGTFWWNLGRGLGGTRPPAAVPVLLGGWFALMVVMLVVVMARSARQHLAWRRLALFALANQMSFARRTNQVDYPGLVFSRGHDRRRLNHVHRGHGLFADAGEFVHEVGSDDQERAVSTNYAAYRLPRPVPHLVIDSRANNLGPFTGLGATLRADQRLSLGGAFDEHHALYAPEGYGPDAYQLFSTDVLEALASRPLDFDVELTDRWVLCFGGRELSAREPATWQRLADFEARVVAPLARNAERYADRSVAAPVTLTAPPPPVAEAGQRLRRRLSPVMWACIGVMALSLSRIAWEVVAGWLASR